MKTTLKITEFKVAAKTDRDDMKTRTITIKAIMPFNNETLAFLGWNLEELLVTEMNVKQLKLEIADKKEG